MKGAKCGANNKCEEGGDDGDGDNDGSDDGDDGSDRDDCGQTKALFSARELDLGSKALTGGCCSDGKLVALDARPTRFCALSDKKLCYSETRSFVYEETGELDKARCVVQNQRRTTDRPTCPPTCPRIEWIFSGLSSTVSRVLAHIGVRPHHIHIRTYRTGR